MTKITKLFSLVMCLVFAAIIFTSIAYADIPAPPDCLPGQDPKTSFCAPAYNPLDIVKVPTRMSGDREAYVVVGGVVLLVITVVSSVVLIIIRQK
jgi:hypothetical protein